MKQILTIVIITLALTFFIVILLTYDSAFIINKPKLSADDSAAIATKYFHSRKCRRPRHYPNCKPGQGFTVANADADDKSIALRPLGDIGPGLSGPRTIAVPSRAITFPFQKRVLENDYTIGVDTNNARQMINSYFENPLNIQDAEYFIMDAYTLSKFIFDNVKNDSSCIQDVVFYMARSGTTGNLTLVLSGIDNKGLPVLFSPNQVLENSYPCPECIIHSNRKR